MAEDLTPDDVEAYSGGRITADDPETQRALDAALARVRRYCGWYVSPVTSETLIFDTPYDMFLLLPTLKIVSIDAVTENGIVTDLSDIVQVREFPGAIAKRNRRPWACGYSSLLNVFSSIEVEFTHGYTAAEAADFREAVLGLIDDAWEANGSGGTGTLVEKEVDDVRYKWSEIVASVPYNTRSVDQFRILPL